MSQLIGQNIIRIRRAENSNNYAISQVRENEVEEGTVFLAYEQTAGKGQLSNRWESEAGKNLTFSIFVRPGFLDIRKQFMISKVICLGIESFISRFVSDVHIKWPNDIYIDKRKIGGVLIENSVMNGDISQSIIGIGININQTQFISDAPNPVSLKMISGKEYNLDDMIDGVLQSIDSFYSKLINGEEKELDYEFEKKLYQINQWYTYQDELHTYLGKILGVNEIGQLKIKEQNGPIYEYHFKEVAYL